MLAVLLLWLGYEVLTFPDTAALATENPKTTAFMDRRREMLRDAGKDDALQYRFVAYGRISPYLRRAVLVAEDDQFYEHEGVDVQAMRDALERDWKRRKITHGGSTITQQLAKNLYLSPSRNPVRKVREYFIARSLERNLSKKRILELYLNVVEMGERVYGAEAASRFYFQKSASALSTAQAALLAGCLPNPRIMNPGAPNKRLRARQRMILSRMKRWGYLLEREVLTEKKPAPAVTATESSATTATDVPVTDTDLAPPTASDATTTDAPDPAASESAPPTQTDAPEPQPEEAPPAVDAAPPSTTTTR